MYVYVWQLLIKRIQSFSRILIIIVAPAPHRTSDIVIEKLSRRAKASRADT